MPKKRIKMIDLNNLICLALATLSLMMPAPVLAGEKTETIVTTGLAMAGQGNSRRDAMDDAMRRQKNPSLTRKPLFYASMRRYLMR